MSRVGGTRTLTRSPLSRQIPFLLSPFSPLSQFCLPHIPLHCLLCHHFAAHLRCSSASFPQDLPFPFFPPPPRRHPPRHRHLGRPRSLSSGSPLRRTGGATMEDVTTTAPPSAIPSTSPQWPPSDSLAWRWGPPDLAVVEVGATGSGWRGGGDLPDMADIEVGRHQVIQPRQHGVQRWRPPPGQR